MTNTKLITGTVLFFILFTLRFAKYVDLAPPQQIQSWGYLICSILMLITVALPLAKAFFKKPLSHAPKFLLVLISFLLLIYSGIEMYYSRPPHHFFTSAFILYLTMIIVYFENALFIRAAKFMGRIKKLRSKTALKKIRSTYTETNTESLQKGDVVKVKTGEIIPWDGIIISGTTSVDESTITGQFKPILKTQGDPVVGGTVNRDSDIVIQLTKELNETVLEVTRHFLENTQSHKFPIFKKASIIALVFSFIGLLAGIGSYYYYSQILQMPQDITLNIALSVLLSFSLVSLPTSVLIAINIFQDSILSKGIVLKNTNAYSTINSLDLLFLDKTGTLSRGNFEYSQYFLEMGTNQGRLLSTFFSLTKLSDHPLSQAMESHPWYHEIYQHPVEDFKTHPGLGICGRIKPKSERAYFAVVGNLRFLKRMQMYITREMKSKIDDLEAMGETVLLCGYDRQIKGILSFADTLRPHVRSTIKEIHKENIETAILTGDSEEAISRLVNESNIKRVYSRCTPTEKAAKISKEVNEGNIVGFIGSKGNKLPFKEAHLNMTLDTGPGISTQQADALIMSSNFRLCSWLLINTRKLYSRISARFTASIIFGLLFAGTSAWALTTPEFIMTIMLILNLLLLKSASSRNKIELQQEQGSHQINDNEVETEMKMSA